MQNNSGSIGHGSGIKSGIAGYSGTTPITSSLKSDSRININAISSGSCSSKKIIQVKTGLVRRYYNHLFTPLTQAVPKTVTSKGRSFIIPKLHAIVVSIINKQTFV